MSSAPRGTRDGSYPAGARADAAAKGRRAAPTARATTSAPANVATAPTAKSPGSPRMGAAAPASTDPTTVPRLNVIPEYNPWAVAWTSDGTDLATNVTRPT